MHTAGVISLSGVRVHNLRSVDLQLPHRKLIVVCGVSGSGKSSLAFDTLYAEGQRRYIESFSAYTRQFLERLDKVDADRIEGIPPAVAVGHAKSVRSGRSTVGTTTEINDYLRLLYAKIGRLFCVQCEREVHRHNPQDIADELGTLGEGRRLMVTFTLPTDDDNGEKENSAPKKTAKKAAKKKSPAKSATTKAARVAAADARAMAAGLRADGFVRVIVGGRTWRLDDEAVVDALQEATQAGGEVRVVVDRLTVGSGDDDRLFESVEAALAKGRGVCQVLVAVEDNPTEPIDTTSFPKLECDGKSWAAHVPHGSGVRPLRSVVPAATAEAVQLQQPVERLPAMRGFGNTIDLDMDLVVPDRTKSLRQGAIAPWNTPAYEHELRELVRLAVDYDLRLDVPYEELSEPRAGDRHPRCA
ncbi:MAG: hypothetical protein R3C10_11570 [Pirellulales bacterium]